ncbi:MAG TPA: ABC transporter permease, partial [Solirubrobacteraceae bacterium]|nr:ABC transporter permease [Solirubrobacteraceae bacterium]
MRWLLGKDLLILRRSRLLVAVLVIYPVAIALLIGLALSRAPSRPRVAVVDLSPPGAAVELGGTRLKIDDYYRELFGRIEAVPVATRAEAVEKVKSGDVLAAVVIPADIAAKLSSVLTQPRLEVIYNGDALEQSVVQSTIASALAEANLALSQQIRQLAGKAIDTLVAGGDLSRLGSQQSLPGLGTIPGVLHRVLVHQPPGKDRRELERVAEFADFATRNLNVSKEVLSTVGQPVEVKSTLLRGRRTPLNAYAVVVAVSFSLMLVCVLLAAGGVAIEREESTLPRLLRGLVSPTGLVVEKLLLAAVCAFALAFALLAGIGAFVTLDWGRVALWLLALAFGALAFGALGVAIGALAREVRAASLLAFLLSLPLAFLALVPSGAVAGGLYTAIRAISFA